MPSDPFKELSARSTVLVQTSAEKSTANTVEVIKRLLEDHDGGVIITVNQPYPALNRILEEKKIERDPLYFIDCISKSASEKVEKSDRCTYISSPGALTEIGIAMTQAIEAIRGGRKFVFIDSLGTFLIYTSAGSLSKFSHFLITKISIIGVTGIIMLIEKEMDEKLLSELRSFCEKSIKL